MTNLTNVEKVSKELGSIENISKELKRVQSIKCRLKKQKGKSTYEQEMVETLSYEQVLKEARQLLDPKEKNVTMYIQEDVDILDYDETIKAIRSIQSKKTLTKWLTTDEGQNDEYKRACIIEKMLISHKSQIKPLDDEYVRKTNLVTIIDTIESNINLSQEKVVELLKSLI